MKIAWFTPFTKKSAIGKYSQIITDELSAYHSVDLWLFEKNNLFDTKLNKRNFLSTDNDLTDKLNNYDLCIYNLGNFLPYHKDIYEVSKKSRGIIILHDYVMHHFFIDYFIHLKKNIKEYFYNLQYLYGNKFPVNSNKYKTFLLSNGGLDNVAIKFPFFETAISGAYGTIVHSDFFRKILVQKNFVMINQINLPAYYDTEKSYQLIKNKGSLVIPKNKLLYTTIGHVNPNKHIDTVIKILGKNKILSDKIFYLIIGEHNNLVYFKYLTTLIHKNRLENSVKFVGFQQSNSLNYYLNKTDVFINLRYPVTEGASWSVIEQMSFGKPVITLNNGSYKELPTNILIKVNNNCDDRELENAMEDLCTNGKKRQTIGVLARNFVKNNYQVSDYVKNFNEFINKVLKNIPSYKLVDKVSNEIPKIFQSNFSMNQIDNIVSEIEFLIS